MESKKIIIIGSEKVGKTIMVKRFVNELNATDYTTDYTDMKEKNHNSEHDKTTYNPTVGVEIYPIQIKNSCFILWDCSGNDIFNSMRDAYWGKSKGAICIIDLNDKTSIEIGKRLIDLFIYIFSDKKIIIIYINKSNKSNNNLYTKTNIYCKNYFVKSVDDVSNKILDGFLNQNTKIKNKYIDNEYINSIFLIFK